MSHLPYQIRRNRNLRKEVEDWVIDHADGMFLLAQVYLDGLEELTNSNDADGVRDSTREMLETYHTQHTHYCDFLERLSSRIQSHGGYTDARRALTLVAISSQQLTTIELQYVLSTSFMKSSEGDWPEINDILLACAGLLEINDWRNTISLSHDFVRDFLQENLGADLATGKADLAALCIDYVSSGAFDTGPCSNEDDFKERLQSHPFYSYAATNWGSYAYKGLIRTSRVVDFLSSESAAQAAGQALMIHGHEDVVETLLDWDSDIEAKEDNFGQTPLLMAVRLGDEEIAHMLLDEGADIEAVRADGKDAVQIASTLERKEIYDLLTKELSTRH
ncbi:putative ankyrin repeat protein [Colletotrichum fructicola]|nr:putative ankyrin repeat protein [Colletotrichum fructicola]